MALSPAKVVLRVKEIADSKRVYFCVNAVAAARGKKVSVAYDIKIVAETFAILERVA